MSLLTLTVKDGNGLLFTNPDGSEIVIKCEIRTRTRFIFHIQAPKEIRVNRLQDKEVLEKYMEKKPDKRQLPLL